MNKNYKLEFDERVGIGLRFFREFEQGKYSVR